MTILMIGLVVRVLRALPVLLPPPMLGPHGRPQRSRPCDLGRRQLAIWDRRRSGKLKPLGPD
eukprot:9641628-Alexandrium_andersonii.AAC.1